jgi:hypothetical protein
MWLDILHLDTREKALLDTFQDGMVLDNGQVLRLSEKLLVGVDAGAEHLACPLWAHLVHLLRHLAGG